MQTATIKIPVEKIISETDRKHGGQGNIETLARSIAEHGLIQEPAVKEIPGKKGLYRVIAGRRRMAAVKLLGWKDVKVIVFPEEADEEAVALAENVNREDMHPLDEAETFRRLMEEEGKTAEDLALIYSRSVSAIHHRARLTKLTGGMKTMFREGKITISGAAIMASLPEEDQERFLKKFAGREVSRWDVSYFVATARKLKLRFLDHAKCTHCRKRTRNEIPGLFEEYANIEDVCLDGECYAELFLDGIGALIKAELDTNPSLGDTEYRLILEDLPPFLPSGTETVTIAGTEYGLPDPENYEWSDGKTGKQGEGTAWLINFDGENGGLRAAGVYCRDIRMDGDEDGEDEDEEEAGISAYYLDRLPDIGEKDRPAVEKLLKNKYNTYWTFRREIRNRTWEGLLKKRLERKDGKDDANLAAAYFEERFTDDSGKISPEARELADVIFGPIKSFGEIPKDPLLQKCFKFLIAGREGYAPDIDLDDDEEVWEDHEKKAKWKMLGITREDYIKAYTAELALAVRDAEAGEE